MCIKVKRCRTLRMKLRKKEVMLFRDASHSFEKLAFFCDFLIKKKNLKSVLQTNIKHDGMAKIYRNMVASVVQPSRI